MEEEEETSEIDDLEYLLEMLPPEKQSSLLALASAGVGLKSLKVACLTEVITNLRKGGTSMSSYDEHEVATERPKKKLLDLSNYFTVPVNENEPDGEVEIYDEGAYEDETQSILKRLEVFDFQCIKVTEDVAAALIDKNPECFKNCPDFQIINKDGEQSTKNK